MKHDAWANPLLRFHPLPALLRAAAAPSVLESKTMNTALNPVVRTLPPAEWAAPSPWDPSASPRTPPLQSPGSHFTGCSSPGSSPGTPHPLDWLLEAPALSSDLFAPSRWSHPGSRLQSIYLPTDIQIKYLSPVLSPDSTPTQPAAHWTPPLGGLVCISTWGTRGNSRRPFLLLPPALPHLRPWPQPHSRFLSACLTSTSESKP